MEKHGISLETEIIETPQEIPVGELLLAEITNIQNSKMSVRYEYKGKIFSVEALSTVSVDESTIGRQAVLSFVNGSVHQPIILGLVHNAPLANTSVSSPLYEILENYHMSSPSEASDGEDQDVEDTRNNVPNDDKVKDLPITVDGKSVVVNAEEQLQLKCGDASITLTKEGKVLIRGKYVLNRASGVNRIVGGSVQVN